jgi:hypothetical protein
MRRALAAFAIVAALCIPRGGAAQVDATLRRIEELAGSGRFTEARATLQRWNLENPETRTLDGDTRAHALLLGARLAVDPAAATEQYLAVVLGYPFSPRAAEALLRLGQGLVARANAGDRAAAPRANAYLQRLISDYPGNPYRTPGLLWLVRAQVLAGRTADACRTAVDALADGVPDPEVDDMLRVEHATWCEGDGRDR